MANDILIRPTASKIEFSGSAHSSIRLEVQDSGSVVFQGSSGSLFGITDSMSGSLFSVNDISGLPIMEVFSDDKITLGRYQSPIIINQSGSISGSLTSTASFGSVNVGGVDGSKFVIKENMLSGSALSTGSFGSINAPTGSSVFGPQVGVNRSSANIGTGISGGNTSNTGLVQIYGSNYSQLRLQVAGTYQAGMYLYNSTATATFFNGYANNTSYGGFRWTAGGNQTETDGTEIMRLWGGRLGIMNASPSKTLTVGGDISGSGDLHVVGNINLTGTGSISGSLTSTASFGKYENIVSFAGSAGTETSFSGSITSTGSFGRVNVDDGIKLSKGGSAAIFNVNEDGKLAVGTSATVGQTDAVFYAYGHMHIRDNHQFVWGTNINSAAIHGNASSNIIKLKVNTNHYAVWDATGLGVNTQSPSEKLHVVGNALVAGNLKATGDIRADGDVIANKLIVSSSVTHMTTSFSSGSTRFGDTNDDIHEFTGSITMDGALFHSHSVAISGALEVRDTYTSEISGSGVAFHLISNHASESTDFVDSSQYGNVISASSDGSSPGPQHDTSYIAPGGFGRSSIFFHSTDQLAIDDSYLWNWAGTDDDSSKDWTIDFWVRLATGASGHIISYGEDGDHRFIELHVNSANTVNFQVEHEDSNSTGATTSGNNIVDNQWTHIALVGRSQRYYYYQDGQKLLELEADGKGGLQSAAGKWYISGYQGNNGGPSMHLDQFRIVVGQALYNGSFTPRLAPPNTLDTDDIVRLKSIFHSAPGQNTLTASFGETQVQSLTIGTRIGVPESARGNPYPLLHLKGSNPSITMASLKDQGTYYGEFELYNGTDVVGGTTKRGLLIATGSTDIFTFSADGDIVTTGMISSSITSTGSFGHIRAYQGISMGDQQPTNVLSSATSFYSENASHNSMIIKSGNGDVTLATYHGSEQWYFSNNDSPKSFQFKYNGSGVSGYPVWMMATGSTLNVGIGITDLDDTNKLQVGGNALVTGSLTVGGTDISGSLEGTGSFGRLDVAGDSTITGSLGINTGKPVMPLEIYATSAQYVTVGQDSLSSGNYVGFGMGHFEPGNYNKRKIAMVYESIGDGNKRGNYHVLVDTANDGGMVAIADSKFKIDAHTGFVGIGMTNQTVFPYTIQSPSASLHVSGTVIAEGDVTLESNISGSITSTGSFAHVEVDGGNLVLNSFGTAQANGGHGLWFRKDAYEAGATNQPSILVRDHSGANADGLEINAHDGVSFSIADTDVLQIVAGKISGSLISTGSFGKLLGDGSSLTGVSAFPYNSTTRADVTGSMHISSSVGTLTASLVVEGSGSEVFTVKGTNGTLFSISDELSGSLFAVTNAAGLPVVEAFSNNKVNLGPFSKPVGVTDSGSLTVSGSMTGVVVSMSIASTTASMDARLSNFFHLQLASGADTYLTASNISPGQSINLQVTQQATSGTISYSDQFKFPNGMPYAVSATGSGDYVVTDLVSFVSFDSQSLFGTALKNLT